jgi:hypothetical protein
VRWLKEEKPIYIGEMMQLGETNIYERDGAAWRNQYISKGRENQTLYESWQQQNQTL